jgi:NAD-dependent DNA ligase
MKLAFRGEIIIKNRIFVEKYNGMYPKARSLIAGIVNSKTPENNIVSDMEIVFYEIMSPEHLTFIQQFELLAKMDFNVAKYKLFQKLEESQLPEIYINFKKESNYEIDGIVLDDSSQIWPRVKKDNPEYAVAFKMPLEEQIANTTVINVEYNISKHGTLAPRIEYKPIMIKGDLHRYTTGFNLKYIVDNKINIGTELQIIKSGDVIPYIYKILKPSSEPMMPDKSLKWHWTERNVDAVLDNPKENDDVIMQKLVSFFTTLKITGVAEGVIRKFISAGYNNLSDILQLTPDIITNIDGFQKKSAENIYSSIHKIIDKPQKLERIMMACGVFEIGLGEKKFKLILDAIPNFYKKYSDKLITRDDIMNISGFSDKTTNIFLSGMPKFVEWLENHPMIKIEFDDINKKDQIEISNNITSNIRFKGMNAIFTGFRNTNLENIITSGGGVIGSAISSKTTIIIAKDPFENSSKLKKAREMNIKIYGYNEFIQEYNISG